MDFTRAIILKLGTKPEPFGWPDIISILLILLAFLLLASIEFIVGHAVRQIAASAWRKISSEFDRANSNDRNGN